MKIFHSGYQPPVSALFHLDPSLDPPLQHHTGAVEWHKKGVATEAAVRKKQIS